jgi:putative FmdB family regulatory protein
MPIYEYRCADCGAHVEKMQKISDEPLKVCESCGGRMEKQISRSGFQFKGSGWYVTDYSDKGKSGGESTKTADGKTETKSPAETKTEKSSAGESTAAGDGASKTAESKTSTKDSKTD